MDTKDSDKDFTFSIEGKEYTISEKNDTSKSDNTKDSKKQTLHVPSLTIGAIISGICIAVVVFGIGDLTGSSSPLIEKQLPEEQVEPVQITMDTFFENGSPILGNPNAEITVIEFGDYQCHFCNVHFQNTEHKIFDKYVMTGKVNVIFKDYTIIGQDSVNAAHAAHCASDQGKFWEYHDILFSNWSGENNGWASGENILGFAKEIGLDMDEFVPAQPKYPSRQQHENTRQAKGVMGTEYNLVRSAFPDQPYEIRIHLGSHSSSCGCLEQEGSDHTA